MQLPSIRTTLVLLSAISTGSATNPVLNLFSDWEYGGSVYAVNYQPSGACVDLPDRIEGSASSARLEGTSCCLYRDYECTGATHYLIQADLAEFPSGINDHLGSVVCWNGYTPSSCGSGSVSGSRSEAASVTKPSARSSHLGRRGTVDLTSGLAFAGGNHVGNSLTAYAEDVQYAGTHGIPAGIVYSGASEIAQDVYRNDGSHEASVGGTVVVGGISILWDLGTDYGSGSLTNFLDNDMSQAILSSMLTDALHGMLDRNLNQITFSVSATQPFYNGFAGTITIHVYSSSG